MSLLREIQSDAVSDVDIAVVLRKGKVLAARLRNEPLKSWVDRELTGYPSIENLPDYRVLDVHSLGNFTGPFGSGARNAPIPPMVLPKEFRHVATTAHMLEGVAAYSSLLKGNPNENFQSPWPANLVALVAGRIYDGMNCVEAWRVLPANAIVGMLDTVRNRLLSFVLEIEAEAPAAGEAEPGSQPLPQERVTQVFNTYILGGTNALASGSTNVSQAINKQVPAGDIEALKAYLREQLGTSKEDLESLETAIRSDAAPKRDQNLGKRVTSWVVSMTKKAASGTLKVGSTVAGDVLSAALKSYYGLP